jgi:hypothetical protein
MTRWANNQALVPSLAQDFKHAQYDFEGKLKRMLEKERSCNISEMFSWNRFTPLFVSYSNQGTHNVATIGRSSCASLKWTWNESELELFAFITFLKNRWKSTKDFEVMINKSLALKIGYQHNNHRWNDANTSKRNGKRNLLKHLGSLGALWRTWA